MINNIENKVDQSDLQAIVRSRGWAAMKRLAQDLIDGWGREVSGGDTEFTYLREALTRDGRINGVTELVRAIERQGLQDTTSIKK
jgi:hypothetical protein